MTKRKRGRFRLTTYHKVGLAMLAAGLAVFAFGMIRFLMIKYAPDVSKLDKLTPGTYVRGSISSVMSAHVSGEENGYANALRAYMRESELSDDDGAMVCGYLTDLAPKTGEFVVVEIDGFVFTDIYNYFALGLYADPRYEETFEFEGVIERAGADEQAIELLANDIPLVYDKAYYEHKEADMPGPDTVSGYKIVIKDLSKRKLFWIYGIPLMIGGIVLCIMGGSFFGAKPETADTRDRASEKNGTKKKSPGDGKAKKKPAGRSRAESGSGAKASARAKAKAKKN
ncbi:MAG: hypothetical protein IJ737_03590 [Ruminococcus sp.]|nr:hypothetical protein [Ruminococcus sp.]